MNYHRPAATDVRLQDHSRARAATCWIINGVKHRVANAPIAQLFAVEVAIEAPWRQARCWCRAMRPALRVREPDSGRRWYHGACGEVDVRGLPRAGR